MIARYMSAKFVPATSMKIAIAHCVAGAKSSTERFSVEKPAVETAPNAWATARNRSIRGSMPVQPNMASVPIAIAVMPM